MKDLTTLSTTICGRIEEVKLIPRMSGMSLIDLQTEFLAIIEDPAISISKETKYKWLDVYHKNKSKERLMFAITNLYLKGAGMGV